MSTTQLQHPTQPMPERFFPPDFFTQLPEHDRPKHDRRGRRLTFPPGQRAQIAELIRQFGIAGAKRQIAFPISKATLGNIAREHGITLRPGRRRAA
ncbi:MAG: hypothetical protein O2820_25965 [Planctomycetota bacterium]|nr:hypothetical protein [Planctomycetota bacterium]MDA1252658.1 hypothetical protein [Planctomycetota bacterium]